MEKYNAMDTTVKNTMLWTPQEQQQEAVQGEESESEGKKVTS